MKKHLFIPALFAAGTMLAQQGVYDNFEGSKVLCYSSKTGQLDTAAMNPSPNSVNGSPKCAKYIRSSDKKFDNIKMCISGKLADVGNYATYTGMPPKIKMKVYSSAPPGTLIEVLLGNSKGSNDFPEGTNSQYQAYTKKTNEWEELEFTFSQVPKGSQTPPAQVDQITLLFNPNSSTSDTYYFDEITGPGVTASAVPKRTGTESKTMPPKK